MGGPLLVRLCMCRFEEVVCKFVELDLCCAARGMPACYLECGCEGWVLSAAVAARLVLHSFTLITSSRSSNFNSQNI